MITVLKAHSVNASISTPSRLSVITRLAAVIALLSLVQLPLCAQKSPQHSFAEKHAEPKKIKEFTNWPAGASPQEIGKRVANRYLEFTYLNLRRNPPSKFIKPNSPRRRRGAENKTGIRTLHQVCDS